MIQPILACPQLQPPAGADPGLGEGQCPAPHPDDEQLDLQRLTSLGLLATRVAHDFNTMLAPILAAAQLLLFEHPAEPEARQLLQQIVVGAQRAADLSSQITRFARRDGGPPLPLDLGALVREMVALLRLAVPLEVELRVDAPAVWLVGQPTHLRQVVLNLVMNAAEAIGAGPGVVEVSVGSMAVGAERQTLTGLADDLEPGPYVYLCVADSGRGMSGATMGQIFELWASAKPRGSGIGLSTALGVARAHGGTISVQSAEAAGAAFTVWLPARDLGYERARAVGGPGGRRQLPAEGGPTSGGSAW